MGHEHTGDCCGQHEHRAAEQLQQLAHTMGSLCCSGQCHHPEHQGLQYMLEAEQQRQQLMAAPLETAAKPLEEKKKTKKKKAARLFGQLLSQTV
jgi:hypothetical protein